MKRKSYLNKKSIRIIFTSFLFALIQVTLFTSCKKSSESFSLLNFSGVDNITNYSKMLFVSHPEEKDSLNFATLPVSKYDILLMEDYVFIYDDLPDNIRFGTSEDGNFTTINDKIYSIYIPADESLLPWFESIENKDLSALSFIDVDAKLNEVYLPHLKNLAGLVPGVGIHIDMDENKELLEIFNPRYLFSSFTNDDFNLFSKLSNLEVLQLDYIETNGEKPLPNMPKLKHIVFDLSNFSGTFSDDFFIHNKQLEKLTFLFLDQIDLSVLKPLNHL